MKLAIVGAGGFVGANLTRLAIGRGWSVVRILRSPGAAVTGAAENGSATHVVGEADGEPARRAALSGADAVVFLAARVHRMRDRAADPLADYLAGNRDLAVSWARSTAASGVPRFVYVSSLKAAAERSPRPLVESDAARPEDPYGIAKLAAETALMTDDTVAQLQRVVVRPPLVYGPGVRENFLRLVRLALSGWPLPLASATSRRSMISAGNLGDALMLCAQAPAASGRTFYVSDGVDLSIAELLLALRRAAGLPPRLFHVPAGLLRGAAAALARGEQFRRLFDPLQVEITAIRAAIGWQPPQRVEEGLAETLSWYRHIASGRHRTSA